MGRDRPETQPAAGVPSEAEVLSWFTTLSNWRRWGPEDELGTLNMIDAATRLEALSLASSGETLSMSWDIDGEGGSGRFGIQRHMLATGEGMADPARMASSAARGRTSAALEYVGLV